MRPLPLVNTPPAIPEPENAPAFPIPASRLLEANATPSMKVEHSDAATERMIHDQKWPVIRDMVRMLGISSER